MPTFTDQRKQAKQRQRLQKKARGQAKNARMLEEQRYPPISFVERERREKLENCEIRHWKQELELQFDAFGAYRPEGTLPKGLFFEERENLDPADVTWVNYFADVEWTVVKTFAEFEAAIQSQRFDLYSVGTPVAWSEIDPFDVMAEKREFVQSLFRFQHEPFKAYLRYISQMMIERFVDSEVNEIELKRGLPHIPHLFFHDRHEPMAMALWEDWERIMQNAAQELASIENLMFK